jgi:hypothetical protein
LRPILSHRIFLSLIILTTKMKKLFLSTFLALAIAGALVSCSKDSGLTNPTLPMKANAGGGGTTPHPKIVFEGSGSKGTTIDVMDSDGTNVFHALSTSRVFNSGLYQSLTWSAAGGNIAWREQTSENNFACYQLRTGTVTILNNTPTLTSISTILTPILTAGDTEYYSAAAWSSQGSPSVIAFAGNKMSTGLGAGHALDGTPCKIWTIPSSGGASTLLYTGNPNERVASITWSPDGTRIAMTISMGTTSPYTYCMKIINATTGALTDSLGWSQFAGGFGYAKWSNAGKNQIAFTAATTTGASPYIYTYDYSTATLSSAITLGDMAAWSPSNDKFLYHIPNATVADIYSIPTNTTSTLVGGTLAGGLYDWRRD